MIDEVKVNGVIHKINDTEARKEIEKKADKSDINTIKEKIPTQATNNNQLADKDFVNSSLNSITAFYITKNANGDQFNSKAELYSTTEFYSGGKIRIPTRNDYCIVLEDETKENSTTRYIYQNNQWEFQYIVNETALTSEQIKAINSGITPELVAKLQGIDLTNYVKNTDYATADKAGVVRSGNGVGIDVSGKLSVVMATIEQIKEGSQNTRSINPSTQYASTFYGLAKASGDTTQSVSSNAVGIYTDEAKTSIKNMLGIGKWELITEVNLDTETTKYILCSCDEYDKIEIIIRRESNNTALNGNMIFDIVDADKKTLVELYANSNPGYREKFSIMEVNGGYAHCISMSTNNTYASTPYLSRGYYVGKGCKYCLRIPKPNTACDGLSRMTVIGRRK